MHAEDLLSEIKRDADDKIYQIQHQNTERLNMIKFDLATSMTKEEQKIREESEKDILRTEKQMLGRARLRQKLNIMEKRKELIDELIEEGIKKFITSKSYDSFLEDTFNNNYKKSMTISIRKGDRKAEKILKEKKIKPTYTDIIGGFIFTDKKVHINKSFDLHLEKRRETLEKQIAELLKN
ncbi:MAG: hypothetical protein KAI18_02840 [Candidatus Aenigmarchaeota archaeon]|nr:hypothetical protein [Candidatus Aenigmarchaeota archaeon]